MNLEDFCIVEIYAGSGSASFGVFGDYIPDHRACGAYSG
jgi:hypothetical protein